MSWKNVAESMSWLRQTSDEPLFPDMLWSRPENKRFAGKLLIIGGHQQSFTAVSEAYAAALKAGIGTARVILPDSLQNMLVKLFPEAEFAASTPIGSFSRQALGPLLDATEWADGVLLAGDFGRNSETAVLLESFLDKYKGRVTITGDGLDYFSDEPSRLLDRSDTTLVAEFVQLQKLLSGRLLLKHSMALAQIIEALNRFSAHCPAALLTYHSGQIIVTAGSQASTTPAEKAVFIDLAAYVSVWRFQQPGKPFEALTTAIYCCRT